MTVGGGIMRMSLAEVALLVAILLHAALSSPAPATPGWAEFAVGGMLVLAAGYRWPVSLLLGRWPGRPVCDPVRSLAMAALFGMFWLGLLRGIAAGWPVQAMLRDILPLMFLFLPLLLQPGRMRVSVARWPAVDVVALAGGLLAGRFLYHSGADPAVWGRVILPLAPDYLANSPLVSFAACYGLLRPLAELAGAGRMPLAVRGGCCRWSGLSWWLLPAALLGWLAMASAGQRAPLLISVIVVATGALWLVLRHGSVSRPARRVWLLGLILLAGWGLVDLLQAILPALMEKTRLVGGNARLAEWSAVWRAVGVSPLSLCFGLGWGAAFASPAVGGYAVHYAHGLLPYIVLKLGVSGLGLLLLYGAAMVIWCRHIVTARGGPGRVSHIMVPGVLVLLSVLPALVSALGFYTSYKYLGLGVLLWLLARQAGAAQADSMFDDSPVTADLPPRLADA